MNYSILTCGFVCLVLAVNGQLPDEHREVREKCYKEMGLKNDEIQTSAYRQDPRSKCFIKCVLVNLKSISEDNIFDGEQSAQLIPEAFRDQARPVIDACIAKTANIADKCEKPFEGIKCLEDGAPKLLLHLGVFEPPREA